MRTTGHGSLAPGRVFRRDDPARLGARISAALTVACGLWAGWSAAAAGERKAARQAAHELRIEALMRLAEAEPGAGHSYRAFEVCERSRAPRLLMTLRGLSDARGSTGGEPSTPHALTLAQVQHRVLDAETLLLEYALGEERSFLWAVTQTSAISFELPGRAAVESHARRVHTILTARVRHPRFEAETEDEYRARIERAEAEYPAAAAALSRMLLAPARRLAGSGRAPDSKPAIRRIVVVAEGLLRQLPFAALPIPGTRGTPLGWVYEVVNAPSASAIDALRRRPAQRRPHRSLAVVAAPAPAVVAPSGAPSARGSRRLPALEGPRRALAPQGLVPLPGARREARSILDLVPRNQRLEALGAEASRELVLSGTLRGYRYVHFAAHAVFDRRRPERSGIVLSPIGGDGRPRDGLLRLDDVYGLELTADLVVLSACRTALGREVRGEGRVGLTEGFFQAGAAAVVASLWSPDDRATAALMERFYRGMLRRGLAPAAALREAQLAISRERAWRAPYFWAAFVLQGDWRHGS